MDAHHLNQLGLILNIIGTVLVAFAFGNPPSTAEQFQNGRRISLAAFLHPTGFKWGIGLIAFGFLCMFGATLY